MLFKVDTDGKEDEVGISQISIFIRYKDGTLSNYNKFITIIEESNKPSSIRMFNQGEWIKIKNKRGRLIGYKCSICKRKNAYMSNFCPNCGSALKKKAKERSSSIE